jgi:O-acetyl-ADP-ribose deacetylase (regulator of RNase III)
MRIQKLRKMGMYLVKSKAKTIKAAEAVNLYAVKNMDITDVTRGIVAHGVNCQRVMGSGVAKVIRDKWPVVYERFCERTPELGNIQLVQIDDELFVSNCFTQLDYRKPSTEDRKRKFASTRAVSTSLRKTFELAYTLQLPVYMPQIGCGRGGLDWKGEIEPIVKLMLAGLKTAGRMPDVTITVPSSSG